MRIPTFAYVTEGILLTSISTFGLIGNILSIIVLTFNIKSTRTRRQDTFRNGINTQADFSILLRGLAGFDALFLLMALFSFGLPTLSPWFERNFFMRYMALSFGFIHTFRVGSVYTTLAVTFERFQVIVFPLKQMRWKKYILTMVVIFSAVYNVPKYFEMETTFNATTEKFEIRSTSLRQNPSYVTYYIFWSKFLLIEVIPYIGISVMNIIIILNLTKSQRYRQSFILSHSNSNPVPNNSTNQNLAPAISSEGDREFIPTDELMENRENENETEIRQPSCPQNWRTNDKGLSTILLTMSILFIVCQSLKLIPDVYELCVCHLTMDKIGHHCTMDWWFIDGTIRLSHLFCCINSASNFVIYYFNGTKFRQAWCEIYGSPFHYCAHPTENSNNLFRSENVPTVQNILRAESKLRQPLEPDSNQINGLDVLEKIRSRHGPTFV